MKNDGEWTYRVADGLEEEEGEEAANARLPRTEGDAEREGHAGDGVQTEHKRRVYPSQQNDSNEAGV